MVLLLHVIVSTVMQCPADMYSVSGDHDFYSVNNGKLFMMITVLEW